MVMGYHQLGEKLTDEQVDSIKAFLMTLTAK
jgi:hypothetical protein